MATITHLTREVKAWIKCKNGRDEIVRVVPDFDDSQRVFRYSLYYAFSENLSPLGCILFDTEGYWIYDGDILSVDEQEQLGKFIINYRELL